MLSSISLNGRRAVASLLLFGVAASLAGETTTVKAADKIPTRDFFRTPFINRPIVNEAGTRFVAAFGTDDDRTGALVYDLVDNKSRRITASGDRDIDHAYWLGDRHLLLDQSRRKLYADALMVVDASDLNISHAIERDSAVLVVGIPRKRPLEPLVWIRRDAYNDGEDGGVARLDGKRTVDDNQERILGARGTDLQGTQGRNGTKASIMRRYPKPPAGMALRYLCDGEGELAHAVTIENGVETLYSLQKDQWAKSPLDLDVYDICEAGDQPDEIIVLGPRREGKPRALLRANVRTGEVTGVLYEDAGYDTFPERFFRDPETRVITGIQLYRKALETVWFEPALKARQKELNQLFPGMMVSVLGTDLTQKTIVVAVYSDRVPADYYLINPESVSRIASSMPWIKAEQMQPMQTLSYKTRDGFKVEGYLTLPAGASKEKPAPLVVLLHGGPWARDAWGWQAEVQFLASRGYAVFQPNYRGSTGYGWSFPAGDSWEFMKMHNDVTDGVQRVNRSGLTDPKRVAIMGSSFGGFLALCGAAYEKDLYRCAITEAGVFDWKMLMKDAKRDRFESSRYQRFSRELGDPTQKAEHFAKMSPLNQVDNVRIPILVAHGAEDENVSVAQAKRLIAELKRRQSPHRAVLKRGEGHGFNRLDSMEEYYSEVEKFLAENLRPL